MYFSVNREGYLGVAATNILLDERDVAHLGDFDQAISAEEAATAVDGFELKFRDALSTSLNPDPNQLVTLSFPYVDDIQICRVDVSRSPRPVFLVAKGGPAERFVRKGNASPPVTDIRQACEYVHDHWR